MDGIKSLLNSEKALVVLALIIGATVLTATGQMTVDQWQSYTTWLAGFYIAGKTAQGIGDAWASAKIGAAAASAPVAAPPTAARDVATVVAAVTASGEIGGKP